MRCVLRWWVCKSSSYVRAVVFGLLQQISHLHSRFHKKKETCWVSIFFYGGAYSAIKQINWYCLFGLHFINHISI